MTISTRTDGPTFAAVGLLATIIVLIVLAAPFLIKENATAQSLFGLLVAIVTTLLSIYATRHFSKRQTQDELTRYGLQAWRNLDGLAIKLSKRIESSDQSDPQLEQWLLDVDQAKWAWRDLLREIFDLQKRLELETEEVAAKFKLDIGKESDPVVREQLEAEQKLALAKLSARAPLPLRVPVKVQCPTCQADVIVSLGEAAGDTAHTACAKCMSRFPVHRQIDGSTTVGGQAERVKASVSCPSCKGTIMLPVPWGEEVEFVRACPHCQAHFRFAGTARAHKLEDLGKVNAKATCPTCKADNELWLSPDHSVRFLVSCRECRNRIQIEGNRESFTAKLPQAVHA